ncbi:hypothetical protein D0C36_09555 [Mucilaginibacter conchicola]|uniref:Uncharacterized protein n=1 Tax=Mucilaginibacter conchicola TaxID=2303333 RepID=A0A372P040_9SPHI|nr:hypothetical protein [Mucilaginibacter conchicola]RFZ95743.1 hypothetical protein D0C36_09555 [Mucilaginibacter conchicola]
MITDLIQTIDRTVTLAQVRFNTESDGCNFCWRLILDGEEIIVESVDIQAPVFTSKDWIEAIQKYKHHISVKDCNVLVDASGNALITEAK